MRSVRAREPDRVGRGAQVAARRASGREASIATSVPVPIARPRSACASAGASLTPSPTIATTRPSAWSRRTTVGLVGRQHLGDHLVDADLARRPRAAVAALSPVSSTGRRPSALQRARRPRPSVGLTVSATTNSARAAPSQPAAIAVRPARLRRARGRVQSAAGSGIAQLGEQRAAGRRRRRGRRRRPRRRAPRGWRTPRPAGQRAELVARRARRSPGRSGARRRPRARPTSRSASARVDAVGDVATSTRLMLPGR